MRAFIFSLDAFVAFTLALVAIYSLLFFSSIPSSYYLLLTQGHMLAKDILFTASTSYGDESVFTATNKSRTILDSIVFSGKNSHLVNHTIDQTVGKMVPEQFGYSLEVSDDGGKTWKALYDTKDPSKYVAGDNHAHRQSKLSVSSQTLAFAYAETYDVKKATESPYRYLTCGGGSSTAPLLTCEDLELDDSGVPETAVRLVRLTIFI